MTRGKETDPYWPEGMPDFDDLACDPEIRARAKANADQYRDSTADDLLDALERFVAERERTDNLHRARMSKRTRALQAMIREAHTAWCSPQPTDFDLEAAWRERERERGRDVSTVPMAAMRRK